MGEKKTGGEHPRRVRLHEHVTLLEADGPAQMEELCALPEVRAAIVRFIDPRTAVLDASRLPRLLGALEKHGSVPQLADELMES